MKDEQQAEVPPVVIKINTAVTKGRGIALSNDDLLELSTFVNRQPTQAKAHQDMLHALIEHSPAHASYAVH